VVVLNGDTLGILCKHFLCNIRGSEVGCWLDDDSRK